MPLPRKLSLLTIICLLFLFGGATSQVNLPTGKANASVPILDFVSNDGIPLNISLEYTGGGGIRINEFASNVGLGWTLAAGGSITRVVSDRPDDLKTHGFLYTSVVPTSAMPKDKGLRLIIPCGVSHVLYTDPAYHADREMDLFEFNFNGRTGSFRISRDGIPFTTVDSRLKITYEATDMTGVNTRINKFVITTEDGLQYVFDKLDLEEEYEYKYRASGCSQTMIVVNWGTSTDPFNYGTKTGKSFVRSWKLTQILNPFSGKEVKFEYNTWIVDYIQSRYYYKTTNYNPNGSPRSSDYKRQGAKYSGTSNQLSRIVLPDQRKIEFTYDPNVRMDLPSMHTLESIRLISEGKQYKFNYRYFKSGEIFNYTATIPEADKEKIRLMLQSVQLQTLNNQAKEPPYLFSYKGESTLRLLPGRFTLEIDHWGYYNGRFSNYQRVFDYASNRLPAEDGTDIISQSLLDVMKFPTGKSIQFEYEANKSLLPDGTTAITYSGARVKKTIQSDGINSANSIITEYKYELENGKSSGWGYEIPEYTQRMNVFMLMPNSGNWWTENVQPVTPILGIFGVIISAFIDLFTPDYVEETFATDAYNMLPVNSANIMAPMYSRVEVLEGSVANNIGKRIYEFTSIYDLPAVHPDSRTILDSRSRFYNWAYGLTKRVTIYNKEGNIVKSNAYEYQLLKEELTGSQYANSSARVNKMVVVPTTELNPFYLNKVELQQHIFYPLKGRAELTKSIERIYDLQGNVSETSTIYEYNQDLNISQTTTKNSRGDLIRKSFRYPGFYLQNSNFMSWTNLNFINTPVYNEEWLTPAGTSEPLLTGAEAIQLTNSGAGGIKPAAVYRYNSRLPTPASGMFYSLSSPVPQNASFKIASQYGYSDAGSLNQVETDGRMVSKIYDDYGMFPTATVINAAATDIAYTSLEQAQFSSWTIVLESLQDLNIVIPHATAPTGQYVARMTAIKYLQRKGLNASKTYNITCWLSGGAQLGFLEGTTSEYKELVTIGDWKLVSVKITGVTEVNLHTNRIGYLDELRLMPDGTYMETVCYKSGGAVTSTCNAANNITRLFYDEADRLTTVKDMYWNTVKTYCYDIAGMQINCRQIWFNTAYSQQFTRNNCPPGNVSSPVTYQVPVGKHASQINQADADAKAVADAAANGQNFANQNGVCSNTIYARLSTENEIWDPTSGYGDVVVHLYADIAGTLPISNQNLSVNFRKKVVDTENGNSIEDLSAVVTGPSTLLDYSVVLWLEYENGNTLAVTYTLLPGVGYTIIP